MDRCQNFLTSPQRQQQRERQALRELQIVQNVEESPRRRSASAAQRPETPTPQPGYAERARASSRALNRVARDMDLLRSPRRRRVGRSQDENALQSVSASNNLRARQTPSLPTPSSSQHHERPSIAQQERQNCERQEERERETSPAATIAPQPRQQRSSTPELRPSLPAPNRRSLAQQCRRAREREERLCFEQGQEDGLHTAPLQNRIPHPTTPPTRAAIASMSNRSLAQQRRRAREREGRRFEQDREDRVHTGPLQNRIPLPTPPPTQAAVANAQNAQDGLLPDHNEGLGGILHAVQGEDQVGHGEGVGRGAEPRRGGNGLGRRAPHVQNDQQQDRQAAPATAVQRAALRLPAQQGRSRNLFLAGRRPYQDPPQRHDLGPMDIPCPHCGALHWLAEKLSNSSKHSPKFGMCCMEGKVQLPALEAPPEPLRQLLTSEDRSAKTFRDEIWKYNRAFAFTSLGVDEDHSVNHGRGPPVFRIFGELHHRSGALAPIGSRPASYAQLYIYEPRAALDVRMAQNAGLDRAVMDGLQTMLSQHHQYVPVYRHAFEILRTYDPRNDAEVRLRLMPGLDRRRYNLPTADEVAVILPGNHGAEPRDIVLRLRSGPLHRISDLHPAYAPLQYPLLFPRGENGWYPEMRLHETGEQRDGRIQRIEGRQQRRRNHGLEVQPGNIPESRRLTLTRYVAHRIHYRPEEFNPLLRGGRLFTRYVVDMFASADQQRLSWIERNQQTFRAARFNNLEDAAANDDDNLDLNDLGQRVILPSSYTGGPRNLGQGFQDSMAIARYFRKVDIFLTMTTNPRWAEIERELLPGQTAYDRPDLVTRVFQLKKKAVVDYIYKFGVFGSVAAYVYTIEFQKRGLPHMHILIFLKEPYKLLTPEAIDS
ncbi:hypothetical protein M413DRAFT_29163, partial [Hebeloma cylindrosporum]